MKIVIFGASGGTGREMVSQGIAAGHEITAFVRNPAAFTQREHLRIVTGDALDPSVVDQVIAGQDAILTALSGGLSDAELLPRSMEHILSAMKRHGLRRLIVLGAAGSVLGTLRLLTFLQRLAFRVFMATLLKKPFEAQRTMQRLIRASDTEWTIVQPPRLVNQAGTGKIRVDGKTLPAGGFSIARTDVATFMLAQLSSTEWVCRDVYIAW